MGRRVLHNQTPVWTLVSGFQMILYKAFYILVNPAGSGQPLKSLRATWISADWRTRRRGYRDQQHEKSSKEHPQTFPSTKQYTISSMKDFITYAAGKSHKHKCIYLNMFNCTVGPEAENQADDRRVWENWSASCTICYLHFNGGVITVPKSHNSTKETLKEGPWFMCMTGACNVHDPLQMCDRRRSAA